MVMTLPMLCREHGYSLDGLRAFIRRTPELRAMGTPIGPSTAYTPAEVAKIIAAWEARQVATTVAK